MGKRRKVRQEKDSWGDILLAALGLTALWAFIDHDSGKIVSKEGWRVLSDPDEMKKVNDAIRENPDAKEIIIK